MSRSIADAGVAADTTRPAQFDATKFTAEVGLEIEAGIRPEDFAVVLDTESHGLAFEPEFIEELGPNRLAHGLSGAAPLVISVATSDQHDWSRRTRLSVAEDHVHLFHRETGRSVRCVS